MRAWRPCAALARPLQHLCNDGCLRCSHARSHHCRCRTCRLARRRGAAGSADGHARHAGRLALASACPASAAPNPATSTHAASARSPCSATFGDRRGLGTRFVFTSRGARPRCRLQVDAAASPTLAHKARSAACRGGCSPGFRAAPPTRRGARSSPIQARPGRRGPQRRGRHAARASRRNGAKAGRELPAPPPKWRQRCCRCVPRRRSPNAHVKQHSPGDPRHRSREHSVRESCAPADFITRGAARQRRTPHPEPPG